MRRSHRVAVLALIVAVAPLLAACREPPPPPPPPAAAPLSSREIARRAVLSAALDLFDKDPDTRTKEQVLVVVDEMLQPRRTYEPKDVPATSRSADVASLPNGRKVLRPKIDLLAAETFDDWVAHATAATPAPKDLTAKLPIEWFSEAGWDALETRPKHSPWRAFYRRFPKSWGWVHLSDVGFSRSQDQALLQESHSYDGCGCGSWLLLRRKDDRWVVIERKRTYIACGPPSDSESANITNTDR